MKEAIGPALEMRAGGGSIKNAGEKNAHAHSQRNALLCALIAGGCLLATYPVAAMGVIDDWSYTRTALEFVRTGHILYNGASVAMLGWQIVWAALFIKLFGFSFTIVRLSMLPVAMASVYLFHQILVRFEIAPRLALFGALTLGLSPLFVPLAASFMTDVPGLFIILLCIFMCQRAVAAKSNHSAVCWLCSAALLSVAGGTARQIAWLGALVMVPSTAWLLRRRHGMLAVAIPMWTLSFVGVVGCLDWFSRQPYAMSEEQITTIPVHAAAFAHLVVLLVRTLLCLLLVMLPILIAWLPRVRSLRAGARARIALSMLALILIYLFLARHGKLEENIMPWIAHVIGSQGVIAGRSPYMLGSRPVTLRPWMRIVISLIVVAAGLAFVEQMLAEQSLLRAIWEKRSAWRELFWILGPFTLSYFFLLLPRAIHGLLFDRYLIPPMVIAIIVLLKLYRQEMAVRIPAIGWVVLSLFAFYTIAATHDWFALDRARVLAAHRILAFGVPRTGIEAGLEYDGWTQTERGGHINEPFIRVPKGAYDPNVAPLPLAPECLLSFSTAMTSVKPKYFLSSAQLGCLAQSKFLPVHYRAWLPPFHRMVYIQQLPTSSK